MASVAQHIDDRAKKVKIFRNGDDTFYGKDFVLNKRRIRTWDSFLNTVTNDIHASEAIRTIRTPTRGRQVKTLEDLEENQNYVAVGAGRFKKLPYTQMADGPPARPRPSESPPREGSRPNRKIQVSGRYRKFVTEVVTIFVFPNGRDLDPPKRFIITHSMNSLEAILEQISDKIQVTGAARKLYTLDGKVVNSVDDLTTGGHYVAVGTEVGGLKKLAYGQTRPTFNNSPKRSRKFSGYPADFVFLRSPRSQSLNNGHAPLPPLKRRRPRKSNQSEPAGTQSSNSKASDRSSGARSEPVSKPPPLVRKEQKNPRKEPPKPRPTASSTIKSQPRDSRASEEPAEDRFHAKEKKGSGAYKEFDYDTDEGGIFKSRMASKDTVGAREVDDSKDTKVDLPVDQRQPEEITEDENRIATPENEDDDEEIAVASLVGSKHSSIENTPTPELKKENEAAKKIQAAFQSYQRRKRRRRSSFGPYGSPILPDNDFEKANRRKFRSEQMQDKQKSYSGLKKSSELKQYSSLFRQSSSEIKLFSSKLKQSSSKLKQSSSKLKQSSSKLKQSSSEIKQSSSKLKQSSSKLKESSSEITSIQKMSEQSLEQSSSELKISPMMSETAMNNNNEDIGMTNTEPNADLTLDSDMKDFLKEEEEELPVTSLSEEDIPSVTSANSMFTLNLPPYKEETITKMIQNILSTGKFYNCTFHFGA